MILYHGSGQIVKKREPQEENDLFFTCALIEYIARETHNHKKDIIEKIGVDGIKETLTLATILHCENTQKTIYEYIEKYKIPTGSLPLDKNSIYKIPTPFEISRVYQRLILGAAKERKQEFVSTLFEVFSSWIIDKINNFNSDLYYLNPEYILACYLEGEILEY